MKKPHVLDLVFVGFALYVFVTGTTFMSYALIGGLSAARGTLFEWSSPLAVIFHSLIWLGWAALFIFGRNVLHGVLGTAEDTKTDPKLMVFWFRVFGLVMAVHALLSAIGAAAWHFADEPTLLYIKVPHALILAVLGYLFLLQPGRIADFLDRVWTGHRRAEVRPSTRPDA